MELILGGMGEAVMQNQMNMMLDVVRDELRSISGIEDTTGVELAQEIRLASNLYAAASAQPEAGEEMSGARWYVLLYLSLAEKLGNAEGVTPTALSKYQNISKNTISSLLRGLEEQKLIERKLDEADKRFFRIRLSAAGRELVNRETPMRIAYTNQISSGLSEDEKRQLIDLLTKLNHSLIANHGVKLELIKD
jgi:DNA-binding MarR family transcriptional regulator